ncbi:MAG: hypothetical protein JSW07_16660, partial [bacterium]
MKKNYIIKITVIENNRKLLLIWRKELFMIQKKAETNRSFNDLKTHKNREEFTMYGKTKNLIALT